MGRYFYREWSLSHFSCTPIFAILLYNYILRLNHVKHNTMSVYVVQEGRNHLLLPKIVDSFHMKNIQCGIYDQLQPDWENLEETYSIHEVCSIFPYV